MLPSRRKPSAAPEAQLTTELLILPDGRILVHNLTQPFADLLHELNPSDEQISSRITGHMSLLHEPITVPADFGVRQSSDAFPTAALKSEAVPMDRDRNSRC